MPYRDNNLSHGIPQNSPFKVGLSDVDNDVFVEQNITLPWASDPAGSYVYYECTVGAVLDSGIVLHNRLPQVDRTADSLGSVFLDGDDLATVTNKGVNLSSRDQYTDIMQRMGHSRYWFRLWGRALRVAYQVPIPAIKKIGGVDAIPYDRNQQWAYNRIFPGGNYGGLVLWEAAWSLWYTTLVPPTTNTIPAASPLVHIGAAPPVPRAPQAPFSQADDNAQSSDPGGLNKPQFGTVRR